MNDDTSWGSTNPNDVSIDTTDSKEMMARSHIMDLHTHECKEQLHLSH